MFRIIGVILAGYTLWSAFEGRVYAKEGAGGRMIIRENEPRYFWTVIVIYGGLGIALMTVF